MSATLCKYHSTTSQQRALFPSVASSKQSLNSLPQASSQRIRYNMRLISLVRSFSRRGRCHGLWLGRMRSSLRRGWLSAFGHALRDQTSLNLSRSGFRHRLGIIHLHGNVSYGTVEETWPVMAEIRVGARKPTSLGTLNLAALFSNQAESSAMGN